MDAAATLAVARRLMQAIAAADTPTLTSLYASNAVIWHCTDQIEMSRSQLVDLVAAIGKVSDCRIKVLSAMKTDRGFVQTQQNTYALKTGAGTSFYAALVVTFDDQGLIARCEEYLDSAGLAPLIAALSS